MRSFSLSLFSSLPLSLSPSLFLFPSFYFLSLLFTSTDLEMLLSDFSEPLNLAVQQSRLETLSPRVSDCAGLRWGLRICICNEVSK
jgi:hypothetical protein